MMTKNAQSDGRPPQTEGETPPAEAPPETAPEQEPDLEGERFVRGLLIAVAVLFIISLIMMYWTVKTSPRLP